MIFIFVEFIDQLIDYPINCASLNIYYKVYQVYELLRLDVHPQKQKKEEINRTFFQICEANLTQIQSIKVALGITKTRLYHSDPLKPHFYIVKLGFTGVCIIFLISAQKHRSWVLIRTALSGRF